MGVGFDFSDIADVLGEVQRERSEILERIGADAVDYAVANGDYQNRTGRLRASNRHEVADGRLTVLNDAPYAGAVESRGYDVLSGALSFVKDKYRLKE